MLNMHLIKFKAPMLALKGLVQGSGTKDIKTKEELAKLEGKINACTQKLMALQNDIKFKWQAPLRRWQSRRGRWVQTVDQDDQQVTMQAQKDRKR